jgi:GNAT superfamily N-acetyltransferase
MKKLEITEADLSNPVHADAILAVTDAYASDPMGKGNPLPDDVKMSLIQKMKEFPGTLCFIAFFDGEPAGIANCFFGFSTFNASKTINIHDLAVMPGYRGRGIGQALLASVEKKAAEEKCCKITLEVRQDNRAKKLYERSGFSYGDPTMYFMTKEL